LISQISFALAFVQVSNYIRSLALASEQYAKFKFDYSWDLETRWQLLKYGNSLGIAAAEAININRIPASNFAPHLSLGTIRQAASQDEFPNCGRQLLSARNFTS
jgi:hypothetical protein